MPDPPEVHPGQRGEGLPDGGLLQGGREPLEGEVLVMRRALAQAPPWSERLFKYSLDLSVESPIQSFWL